MNEISQVYNESNQSAVTTPEQGGFWWNRSAKPEFWNHSLELTRTPNQTNVYHSLIAACTALTMLNVLVGTPANALICAAVFLNRYVYYNASS